MAVTLSGVIGLNVLLLVVLASAHEGVIVQILPQALVARIVLVWGLIPREKNATVEVVPVRKCSREESFPNLYFKTLR